MLDTLEKDSIDTAALMLFWKKLEGNMSEDKVKKNVFAIICLASGQAGRVTLDFMKNSVDINRFVKYINRNLEILSTDDLQIEKLEFKSDLVWCNDL